MRTLKGEGGKNLVGPARRINSDLAAFKSPTGLRTRRLGRLFYSARGAANGVTVSVGVRQGNAELAGRIARVSGDSRNLRGLRVVRAGDIDVVCRNILRANGCRVHHKSARAGRELDRIRARD